MKPHAILKNPTYYNAIKMSYEIELRKVDQAKVQQRILTFETAYRVKGRWVHKLPLNSLAFQSITILRDNYCYKQIKLNSSTLQADDARKWNELKKIKWKNYNSYANLQWDDSTQR